MAPCSAMMMTVAAGPPYYRRIGVKIPGSRPGWHGSKA